MITKRRICWPNPDATCLEGGCNHCKDHPFLALSTIRRWAEGAGVVQQRCQGERPAIDAFTWGMRYGVANMKVR